MCPILDLGNYILDAGFWMLGSENKVSAERFGFDHKAKKTAFYNPKEERLRNWKYEGQNPEIIR